jgi:hypothetical protein
MHFPKKNMSRLYIGIQKRHDNEMKSVLYYPVASSLERESTGNPSLVIVDVCVKLICCPFGQRTDDKQLHGAWRMAHYRYILQQKQHETNDEVNKQLQLS